MRQFEYASPATIDEAIELLGQDGDGATRPLAGGTDLLTLMKADIATPSRVLNIKQVEGLKAGVEQSQDGLTLHALTSLTEIETNPAIRQRYPLLAEAAEVAATPQLRNMATLGGNLLQRPRCWYFRNPRFHCWLKGGEECQARDGENDRHALFGDSPCVAVHPSDLAPALAALDAHVRLRGQHGERTLPIAEFFALPTEERRTETMVQGDELLLSMHIPPPREGTRSTYLKAMDRKVWAFALVGVAALVRLAPDGRRIEEARLVLGGVAPIPWRAQAAAQELLGAELSEDLFNRAAEAALAGAEPLEHNGYKVPLAKALIRRALQTLTQGASDHAG
ncbi:MAG: FAD binding domain-containing protein [Chloroflexota bacterium]|nr:FAD binding domain-containing protein [Chloroflexota bacterium]